MKRSYWILSILLLFVVNTTRIDLSFKKLFSDNVVAELVDVEQSENDTDEEGKEECKDEDWKEYTYSENNLSLYNFQTKLQVVAAYHKQKHPTIAIDSPPPKG